ncbi:hypothetical protein BGX31_010604 [Mortierella sp. GBA43]|nr:hypothetical protein BGX31_010604 [Mortierella sp. GBA43]
MKVDAFTDSHTDSHTADPSVPLASETKSLDDSFQDHKKVFYQSQQLLLQLQRQQQEQQKHDHDDDDETDSQRTWILGMDSPLNQSSSTLAESTTVLCFVDSEAGPEEDVLEKLVQTLESEVKDTRATVLELEGRLNLAEHSNRHIVEELKMLLADAEVTLRNAGKTGNGTSSTHRKVNDEDSNAVYNRICVALQQLIDEAQFALQKNSAAKQPSSTNGDAPGPPPYEESSSSEWSNVELHDRTMNRQHSEHDLERRRSPKNSLTLLNLDKVHNGPDVHQLHNSSPTSFYSSTDEVSRMYWKQKHEEQHDRYRKSCHRLTLELEGSLYSIGTDSDDSEASWRSYRRPRASMPSSAQSTAPSTPTTPTVPLQGILRSSKKDGARRERLKKKYQVQFLNPDIPEPTRRDSAESTTVYRHRPQSRQPSPPPQEQQQQKQKQGEPQQQQHQVQVQQRQYTSRSVGSNSSRGVLIQLYDLWQQTWLRTRIMRVITGSVEIVIIIWVVVKASRMTLTWFGMQPSSLTQWVTYIYGNRQGAGTGAKEIYDKIRRDGLQMRQIKARSLKEPEALVEDLVAGGAALASSTGISPSNLIYGPAKRVAAHAVTGIALAFISDGARRLVRKL